MMQMLIFGKKRHINGGGLLFSVLSIDYFQELCRLKRSLSGMTDKMRYATSEKCTGQCGRLMWMPIGHGTRPVDDIATRWLQLH